MSDYEYIPEKAPVFTGNFPRKVADNTAWLGASGQEEAVVDPDMPIVDAHHHLWDHHNGRYLLHEIVDDIRAGGHNIISTVHVQASSMLRAHGPDAFKVIGETEFCRGIAAMAASGLYGKTRVCEAIIGEADFRLPNVADVLDAHIEAGGGRFRGIRQNTTWSGEEAIGKFLPHQFDAHVLEDANFRKGFKQLGARNLSFDAWVFHPQLDEVISLARAFPDTKIIMNHVGGRLGIGSYAMRFKEEHDRWLASIRTLASLPNTYMKIGGLGMVYGGFGFHTLEKPLNSDQFAKVWRPYVMAGIEAFGPERSIMESNFPVDRQACSYRVLWNALKKIVVDFSQHEKNALFHGVAQKIYRLHGA